MDHYCAPQWVDFSSSPQVPSDDYFEKCHEIYEPNICTKMPENSIKIKKRSEIIETQQDENFMKLIPNLNENYETEINGLKNTPIKVIYPLKHSSGKHEVTKEVTYDDVLHEAMQNVQLCGNLHKVKKVIDLSSTEDVFKKPMLIKNKISKPVQVCEIDKINISISCSEETQSIKGSILDGETKNISSSIDAIKPDNNLSLKITKDITKTPKTEEPIKSNIKDNTMKNNNSEIKVMNRKAKLKPLIVKPQTNVSRVGTSTKANTFDRYVTTCKRSEKVEMKSKTMEKDQPKSKLIQHNSVESHKNSGVLNRDSTVKIKQTPRSCFSLVKQEKESVKRNRTSKKIVSTIVDNTGSEITIKKEEILFFDIPTRTNQKKTTRPVPFSFESRDKIKKTLKASSSESKNIKPESVSDIKSVSNYNKFQRDKSKLGNFAKKGVKSFCNQKIMNEKDKGNKQFENGGKVNTYITSVTLRKPMRVINALKDNQKKDKDKNDKTNTEDIQSKRDANKVQEPLKSISCKNIYVHKKPQIQAKVPLKINKCVEKENKEPNIKVSTTNNNNNVNKKDIKLKRTVVKATVIERNKRREFEERIKQMRIMHEEKLRKEREEKLAKEKLEIAKLRKQAEIKARPMPVYKPLIHIKSTKPLTKPQSPAWSNKHRVTMMKEIS